MIGTGVIMAGWVIGSAVPNTLGVKFAKRYIEKNSPYCKNLSAEPETEALLNEVRNYYNIVPIIRPPDCTCPKWS